MPYSQHSKINYELFSEISLITLFVLNAFWLVRCHFFLDLFWRETNLQRAEYERLPDKHHGKDDNVPDEVKLFVDGPPFVEAQVCKRYETIAGDDECVGFADGKHGNFDGQCLSSFLIFRIAFENWHDLWRRYNKSS
jgi:hypothetical protein